MEETQEFRLCVSSGENRHDVETPDRPWPDGLSVRWQKGEALVIDSSGNTVARIEHPCPCRSEQPETRHQEELRLRAEYARKCRNANRHDPCIRELHDVEAETQAQMFGLSRHDFRCGAARAVWSKRVDEICRLWPNSSLARFVRDEGVLFLEGNNCLANKTGYWIGLATPHRWHICLPDGQGSDMFTDEEALKYVYEYFATESGRELSIGPEDSGKYISILTPDTAADLTT